ncbi:MAG: argininosuccinate lyase [Solidesulfovibrio magneticus str. Maddingley MBC34]|uniref:Argininosuccinate lyase n=1 Tax=Solidesulfovibrio magneticus str. Maddingley MBC34 TaxID=1206767 RepID=K6FGN0_9BACT|nr:MAG: argininosuccinate lyase [Solidesulfovibrio magneticus str. Maddingley MBC34]
MSTKMWGGRFGEGTGALMEAYSESVSYDRRMYRQDIAGSKAHARMLAKRGVLAGEEAERIVAGLDLVLEEIESGVFPWRQELEDVHMNIEQRLTELIGPLGGKLHTGRSRNDQVCLDFRLYVAESLEVWTKLLRELAGVFLDRAAEHQDTLLPGCTHLQPAQPVSLAQHLLAYAWMLKRDCERAEDALKRVRVSPLGAAALAGTTYPLEPAMVARAVGFSHAFGNSMDAVSDRDFALESLFCASVIMAHLSRFCEEIILWANPRFGYVALPDAYATGSSIMPQKKNPDAAELMRGRVGRVYGSLMGLLTVLKGLPLTYNRDLQEDKEPFFDADDTVRASLRVMAGMLAELRFRPERMREALGQGFLNATELADYLAAKGVPFREAHHITGRAVAQAEALGIALEQLTLEQLRVFSPAIESDVFEALRYETAVARRNGPGGTGPQSVTNQMAELSRWLQRP